MKNLAVIPARSGSKGLKDKNMKLLGGRPLVMYSIEAANESKMFDTVMVSTDSPEYAFIAEKCGAEVPFLRSKENSSDAAGSWSVVSEVLSWYEKRGISFDSFCLLQPTSPFRTAEDIIRAYRLFDEKRAVSVVSVCKAEHPLEWYGLLDSERGLDGFIKPASERQRQLQKQYYRVNGAVYIARVKDFLEDHFLYRKGGYAYIMDADRSLDIDTEEDFCYAEFLVNHRYNKTAEAGK